METLLITRHINSRKTYGYEIDYIKGWLRKRNAKGKYSPSLKIEFSEDPPEKETSQIMYRRNELTGSYKTQAVTEMNFRTNYKT